MKKELLKLKGEAIHPITDASAVIVSENVTLDDVLKDMKYMTIEELNKRYLSKISQDTAQEFITFLKGIRVIGGGIFDEIRDTLLSEQSSWSITHDKYGNSVMTINKLIVDMEAIFKVLTIAKLQSVSGGHVYSCCSMKCTNVVEFETFHRCYVGDEGNIEFAVGDQARCQVFNGAKLKYYWSLVVGVGNKYIDLSKSDKDGTSLPEIDDEIIQLGNRTDTSRQSAIMVVNYPYPEFAMYENINSFTLNGKKPICISPKGSMFTGEFITTTGTNVAEELEKRKKYTLVLDNQMASVACDSDGNVIGDLPSCGYKMYEGTLDVTDDWNFSIESENATIEVLPQGFKVTSLSAETSTIKVIASKVGESVYEQCMSISKSLQGIIPLTVYLYITKGDTLYRDNQGYVATLECAVYYNGHDITDSIEPYRLVWERESENSAGDPDWNLTHREIGKNLTISTDDLIGDTVIKLTLFDTNGQKASIRTITF